MIINGFMFLNRLNRVIRGTRYKWIFYIMNPWGESLTGRATQWPESGS